ncbi:TetR family transcriptional regulator [Deinococcus sp. HMF7620]|uniref:TetR family transcriptional regulator n=1 Tax=Deinococcus arboris TaxID=2682977 RepID=A0A7C9LZX2_9DEIO|nr:TetR/AcrR family transcriptional regulator [Deinococcus arboris]MVN85642.1 TetR family transcriptional regulator [Deinococcus arboris]
MSRSTPATADPRTDARVLRSRAAILQVTLDLLTEQGLGGMSIDEVARRSGIAKTTIYRHWPTRSALILDACALLSAHMDVPATGHLHEDITALLTSIAAQLQSSRWSSVLPSVMDAAERDADLAAVYSQLQHSHAQAVRMVLTDARTRGALPDAADVDLLTAGLLGTLFYGRWFSRQALSASQIAQLVTIMLGPPAQDEQL